MKRSFLALWFFAFSAVLLAQEILPALPKLEFNSMSKAKVSRVIDGDTVEIDLEGKLVKVRLLGIDTPETVHPSKPVQAYGKEASEFLKNLIEGESVWLKQEQFNQVDKYGRSLFYLFRIPDGLFINLEIVRSGYGHAYTVFPFEYLNTFREYERRARELNKGLWRLEPPTSNTQVLEKTEYKPYIAEPAKSYSGGMYENDSDHNQFLAETVGATQPKTVRSQSRTQYQSQSQSQGYMVYITDTGEKYHRGGCQYLAKSKHPISKQNAINSGYGPCSRCRP